MTESAVNAVEQRIAELLAEELRDAAERKEFGVLALDVEPLDRGRLLEALVEPLRHQSLRLSLPGADAEVESFVARYPSLAAVVTPREEVAVQWRNKHLRTIAVVATGALAKEGSLRFRGVEELTLRRRLCDQQRDRSQAHWLRTLWEALRSDRAPAMSLGQLAAFAEAIDSLPPGERSLQASKMLPALGLLPDQHLADASSPQRILKRLTVNVSTLAAVRRATSEDWARITAYCASLEGKDRAKAHRIRKRLKRLVAAEEPSLDELELVDVEAVWRGRVKIEGAGKGGRVGQKSPLEQVVARLLIAGDRAQLHDIAEELRQIVDAVEDEGESGGEQTVNQASSPEAHATVEVPASLPGLVRSRSTLHEWGGTIEVGAETPEALTEVSAFKNWRGLDVTKLRAELAAFVEAEVAPATLLTRLDDLAKSRAELLGVVDLLAISPVATLAGSAQTFTAVGTYLAAYDAMLRQLQGCWNEMRAAADFEAEQIIGWLLGMETYVYKKDKQVEVLLSPLHPLYLWRPWAMVRDVAEMAATLAEHEVETLEEACVEDLHLLNVLVLPQRVSDAERTLLLGRAGAVGRLPLFREAPRGVLEPDGAKTVGILAASLAELRPFARPGLQVMLINAPRPSRFLEELLRRLELDNQSADDTYWGLHLRLRYTHPDTQGWTNELDELDDSTREHLHRGQESGLITLSVQQECQTWESVEEELAEEPAHLTVVVDPFEVRTSPVARAGLHHLSPWMPVCEYQYNKLRKQIQIVPVAEEHVFACYIDLAKSIHADLRTQSAANLPQLKAVQGHLETIAKRSTWTVIADPHRVPLASLGLAEVIDRRDERSRQLTCFGHDLTPFARSLKAQLQRTHFLADDATLSELIRDLVAMEPGGILGLAGSRHSQHVKGSLGKLIAMRWYKRLIPSGLAVSLDTPNARRWLVAGGHSREKADLVGLREEGGTIIIDAIEVKAHDEGAPYTIQDGVISGKAVDQVHSTLQALAEVFGPEESTSPLARPRREVLREHLYASLLRNPDYAYVERWHSLLGDLFSGRVEVKLTGRVVHVHLASVAPQRRALLISQLGVPIQLDNLSASDVGLVLKSARAQQAEQASLPIPSSFAQAVEEELRPSEALRRLVISRRPEPPDVGPPPEPVPPSADVEPARDTSSDESDDSHATPWSSAETPVEPYVEGVRRDIDVELGAEHASSQAVRWQPGRQSNGFFLVLGASGSGKTETLKVLGQGVADAEIPVLVLDFHGDVVFPSAESVILSASPSSTLGLNPMEIDAPDDPEASLYDQRRELRDLLVRAVPALGHRQRSILQDAIEEAYRAAGFDDQDPSTWRRTPPSFGDVQDLLFTWVEDDERKSARNAISGCLDAVRDVFEHPIFRRGEHIPVERMLAESIRLDLSNLPDTVRFVATETLLRKLFRVLRLKGPIPVQPMDDRERFRLFVIIDEAKILSTGGEGRESSHHVLNTLFTEARKFGLGMILATQLSGHFGSEVTANAATWLVLKPMDIKEAKKNAPNVGLEAEDLVRLAGKGDGYLRDRNAGRARRIQVRPLHATSS